MARKKQKKFGDGTTPDGVMQAVFAAIWATPKLVRVVLVGIIVVGAVAFPLWVSLPDKTKEAVMDRLTTSTASTRPLAVPVQPPQKQSDSPVLPAQTTANATSRDEQPAASEMVPSAKRREGVVSNTNVSPAASTLSISGGVQGSIITQGQTGGTNTVINNAAPSRMLTPAEQSAFREAVGQVPNASALIECAGQGGPEACQTAEQLATLLRESGWNVEMTRTPMLLMPIDEPIGIALVVQSRDAVGAAQLQQALQPAYGTLGARLNARAKAPVVLVILPGVRP